VDLERLKIDIRNNFLDGDIENALKNAKKALKVARQLKSVLDQADVLVLLATALIQDGKSDAALERLDQAATFILKAERNGVSCELALRCADTLLGMGETGRAKDLLLKQVFAVEMLQESLYSLERIGLCFLGEGEPTKALVYFRELTNHARFSKNRIEQVLGLRWQARVYEELGDYATALRLLELGCRVSIGNGLESVWGECVCEIARVYSEVGYHDKALALLANAIGPIAESDETAGSLALGNYKLIEAWTLGDFEFLVRLLSRELDMVRRTGYAKPLMKALQNKATALNGLGRYKEAQETVWELFDIIRSKYVQYWTTVEIGLAELAVALQGMNYTTLSNKARRISGRALQIRIDRSLPFARKTKLLDQLGQEMSDVVEFLRFRRIPMIRYRGKVIQMNDGSFSIDGVESDEHLTLTERTILEVLWIHRGKYYSDKALVESYYDDDLDVSKMNTNRRKAFIHVSHINNKLNDKQFIEHKTGKGYRIAPE